MRGGKHVVGIHLTRSGEVAGRCSTVMRNVARSFQPPDSPGGRSIRVPQLGRYGLLAIARRLSPRANFSSISSTERVVAITASGLMLIESMPCSTRKAANSG